MHWFFIALGAPFLWAITNLTDQYLVSKYSTGNRGSGGLVLFSSLIGIAIMAVIGIFTTGFMEVALWDRLLLMLAGGLMGIWMNLYFFALKIEDVDVVVTWFLTIPVFGYILGYIFLGETLSSQQNIGALITLVGVFLISVDFSKHKKEVRWRPALYMFFACLISAFIGIIFKYVAIEDSFWISSFWQYAGLGLFGLLIFLFVPKYRNEFLLMNKEGGKKIFSLNIANELFGIGGNLLTQYATLLAPIALVYLVGSFQPAIVLILAILLRKFFPQLIKEKVLGSIIFFKIIAVGIVIAGSVLLLI